MRGFAAHIGLKPSQHNVNRYRAERTSVLVEVDWRLIGRSSRLWNRTRCLYAYVDPVCDRLLYVGKTDGSTSVRTRFEAEDKEDLFEFFESKLDVRGVRVAVGTLALDERIRLTRELISDTEGLLIRRTKPPGNVVVPRITRPGLRVRCLGDWPYPRAEFRDVG